MIKPQPLTQKGMTTLPEVNAGIRLCVQHIEANVMVWIRARPVCYHHSEASAFLKPILRYFRDIVTPVNSTVSIFCIVIEPPVFGFVCSNLRLTWTKYDPTKDIPRVVRKWTGNHNRGAYKQHTSSSEWN